METKNPLLKVVDLKASFFTRRGVIRAVDTVSFTLGRGQTMAVVGESGSGKSTLGQAILRLLPEPAGRIESGQILLNGEDLVHKSSKEMRQYRGKRIALIPQMAGASLNPAFPIGDQVGEIIRLHQHVRGRPLRERVEEALREVKIPAAEARLNDYPHQMSGGMQQRVCGAVAISCKPDLIIADEPTSALDVTTQVQFLDLLRDLQEETGVSLLFITHDFGVVAAIAHVAAVMYAGKLVEVGLTQDIIESPQHPYTEALIRCIPTMDEPSGRLTDLPGQPPDLRDVSPGCKFAPRCPKVHDKCRQAEPPDIATSSTHVVRCWLAKSSHG